MNKLITIYNNKLQGNRNAEDGGGGGGVKIKERERGGELKERSQRSERGMELPC